MATFRRRGTIELLEEKMVARMVGARLRPGVRAALLQPDQGLRRVRLSREPRGELRAPRLRVVLAQVPLSGGVRGGAAQLAADGLLRAGADRARCARARRRGARGRRQSLRLGLHAGGRRRRRPAGPAPRPAPDRRPAGRRSRRNSIGSALHKSRCDARCHPGACPRDPTYPPASRPAADCILGNKCRDDY